MTLKYYVIPGKDIAYYVKAQTLAFYIHEKSAALRSE